MDEFPHRIGVVGSWNPEVGDKNDLKILDQYALTLLRSGAAVRYNAYSPIPMSRMHLAHAILTIPGWYYSEDAVQTVKFANEHGVPVYHYLDELLAKMAK